MVGNRLRHVRTTQQRSLADVAGKADISVATLSRVENNKQALDLQLLLRLAKILKTTAAEIIGDERESDDSEPLAQKLARLSPAERTRIWRELASVKKQASHSGRDVDRVLAQVEELLAQIEFLRSELEAVRNRVRREPRKRARV